MKILKLCRCFAALLVFAFAFSAFAKNEKGTILVDVKLYGTKPKKTTPAIVEYHGPCGTKKSTSVVKLWQNHVIGAALWLSKKGLPAENIVYEGAKIIGHKCDFHPQLTVVPPNTTVSIINNDPYTQWLLIGENGSKKRQIMQEEGGKPVELEVKNGKPIHITSGFYPWMEAWIKTESDQLVTTKTTRIDGKYYFENIPAGDYILHSWHHSLGETYQKISVPEDKRLEVEIIYDLPAKVIPVVEASSLEKLEGSDSEIERDENPFKKK